MTVRERQTDSVLWQAVRAQTAGVIRTGIGPASKVLKAGSKLKVLLVEDNPTDGEQVLHELRRGGFEVACEVVGTAEAFRQRIKERTPDLVLADYNLRQWRGMEALEILRFEGLDVPLILVSSTLGDVTAVECIKQGASDYVLKTSLARLPVSVRRALEETRIRQESRREHEQLAGKAEELARSSVELEQFACAASHDLQEPLRMVAAYTQLLAKRYRGKLDDQADKYIHYAVDGAVRMQSLIQDLLALSRVARQETVMVSTDCNEVVERAIENLQTLILASGAVVAHGPLPRLLVNRLQLQQVFQNLIQNAIKFRGPQPPIIQISAKEQATEWVFSVADNGIGISAEHLENVFIIFKRLHTRTEYPGNGIGLAICKKIVERHHGKIQAIPHEGEGAIFNFTLPAGADAGGDRARRNNE